MYGSKTNTPAIAYGKNIKKPRGSKAECEKKIMREAGIWFGHQPATIPIHKIKMQIWLQANKAQSDWTPDC